MKYPLDEYVADKPERKRRDPDETEALYKLQGSRCMYCGHKLDRSNMQMDHKISKANHGSEKFGNKQLLCGACNRLKGKMNDKDFRRMYGLDPTSKEPPARAIPYNRFDKIQKENKANKPKTKKKDPLFDF